MPQSQAEVGADAGAAASVVRIRLDIAYDGTDFNGWSRQPGLRTVQGVIEQALGTLFRREHVAPRLAVAGRTDAGVHALGQVAHFDVERSALAAVTRIRRGETGEAAPADPASVLLRRLSGLLGATEADVVVRGATVTPTG